MFALTKNTGLKATGTHNSVIIGATAYSPSTPPGGANFMMVQAVTQNIRYTLTPGVDPTAAVGFQLVASAAPIMIALAGNVMPRFIREAAGAVLQYQFFE